MCMLEYLVAGPVHRACCRIHNQICQAELLRQVVVRRYPEKVQWEFNNLVPSSFPVLRDAQRVNAFYCVITFYKNYSDGIRQKQNSSTDEFVEPGSG